MLLHEPRIVVTKLMADDPLEETRRLESAIAELKDLARRDARATSTSSGAGEHRDVLEAYRMFAHDRGWERRLFEAVQQGGLTADAAVERVKNGTRARMLRQSDPFWRERQRDLDDLSDRLLRILAGQQDRRRQPGGDAARHDSRGADHGPGGADRLRPRPSCAGS